MVESIRKSVGTWPYEIILVAGGCEPGTLNWIRAQDDCVLIEMPPDTGAVIPFNRGFRSVKAGRDDYVVALNDDIALEGDTLRRSAIYLDDHPEVGQVAFFHKYLNRGSGSASRGRVQKMLSGYLFGQCCMTRKWIGDAADWWGNYGLVFYGGDNNLSCGVWHMGYAVHAVDGCSVLDWEHDDATREKFSRKMREGHGGRHPDSIKWMNHWAGKLPNPQDWVPAHVNTVLAKAARRNLRTIRFQSMMGTGASYVPRVALGKVFSEYGPYEQANQVWAMKRYGRERAQDWFLMKVRDFQPDLVMLQGQRPNNIMPETVEAMRDIIPDAFIYNWDGDTHYPMEDFHWKIAKACDLQLVVTPDLFPWYVEHGVYDIGYWPIGVERNFIEVDRYQHFQEQTSDDVIFLGSVFLRGYPEIETRKNAVRRLVDSSLKFRLHGLRWEMVGIECRHTLEDFEGNPVRYSQAKMGLSISQTKDYWGYTSDRTYNIMAAGCPVLIQEFKGMNEHGLVDGETCIAWSDLDEMMDKARYYKAHPKEREAIGQAGKEVLLARHTWNHRVEELFGLIARLGE